MKFGLQTVFIWVNIQNKFRVPQSRGIGERCDANFKLSSYFSRKLCNRWTRNLVYIAYPYGLLYKKISSSSVTQYQRKVRCYFQVISAFLLKTVRPRNMKFGFQTVSIWVNVQNKFHVPLSHSIGEKCDANFKLSSHFSRKLCDRETWNFVCIVYPCGLIYKKNFKFLGCTVSLKSAMLISSYHRIFIKNCATEKHEIWFV